MTTTHPPNDIRLRDPNDESLLETTFVLQPAAGTITIRNDINPLVTKLLLFLGLIVFLGIVLLVFVTTWNAQLAVPS